MTSNGRKISACRVSAKEKVICDPPVKGQQLHFVDGFVLDVGKITLKLHKQEAEQILTALISAR